MEQSINTPIPRSLTMDMEKWTALKIIGKQQDPALSRTQMMIKFINQGIDRYGITRVQIIEQIEADEQAKKARG